MCSTIPPNSRAIHMLFGKECMHMFNLCINLQLHTKIQHYILRRYEWFYFPSILFFSPQMLFTCRSRPQQDLYIDAEIKRLRMMFYCSSWTYNYKDVLWHAVSHTCRSLEHWFMRLLTFSLFISHTWIVVPFQSYDSWINIHLRKYDTHQRQRCGHLFYRNVHQTWNTLSLGAPISRFLIH